MCKVKLECQESGEEHPGGGRGGQTFPVERKGHRESWTVGGTSYHHIGHSSIAGPDQPPLPLCLTLTGAGSHLETAGEAALVLAGGLSPFSCA